MTSPARSRLRLCFCLFLVLFSLLSKSSAQRVLTHPSHDPRNIQVDSLSHPLDLTSSWLVHEGDDPRFADPHLDDSSWQAIDTSRPLSAYGILRPDFVWYRVHVHVPPQTRSLALEMRNFLGSEQIFVNGVLTGPSRDFPPGGFTTSNFDHHAVIPDALLRGGDLTIALRAQVGRAARIPGNPLGFSSSTLLVLGDSHTIADKSALFRFRDLTSNFINIALIGIVLLIAIALALTLRSEPEYLALCILLAGYLFLAAHGLYRSSHDLYPNRWMYVADDIVRPLTLLAGIEFARSVLRLPRGRWLKAYMCLIAILATLSLLDSIFTFPSTHGARFFLVASLIANIVILPVDLGLPIFCIVVWRKIRNFDAFLLSLPLLVRSLFVYGQYLLVITAILRHRAVVFPGVPHTSLDVGWDEIGDFFFFITLLLFLILRTVRIARSRAALAAELEAARTVQQLLLAGSSRSTPGFLIESVYLPASEVGGDFFLVSPSPDGSLIAILGDVSGKGLLAAMRVSMILGVLRRESSRNPASILANLNEALHTQGDTGFTTACCVRLDPTGRFTIANAGHISPYISRPSPSRTQAAHPAPAELETSPALPLGLAAEQTYDLTSGELLPGQRLILMSDGVPEARSAQGELYGFDRLPNLIQLPAHDIADVAQRFGQEDDITVLTLALA